VAADPLRHPGRDPRRLLAHLGKLKNVKDTTITTLTEAALVAAHDQQPRVPGEAVAARLIRGLAVEMLAGRDQLHLFRLGKERAIRAREPRSRS